MAPSHVRDPCPWRQAFHQDSRFLVRRPPPAPHRPGDHLDPAIGLTLMPALITALMPATIHWNRTPRCLGRQCRPLPAHPVRWPTRSGYVEAAAVRRRETPASGRATRSSPSAVTHVPSVYACAAREGSESMRVSSIRSLGDGAGTGPVWRSVPGKRGLFLLQRLAARGHAGVAVRALGKTAPVKCGCSASSITNG